MGSNRTRGTSHAATRRSLASVALFRYKSCCAIRAGIKGRLVLSLVPSLIHELAQACKATDWQHCLGGSCVTFISILRAPLSKMLNNRAQTVRNCVRFLSSFMFPAIWLSNYTHFPTPIIVDVIDVLVTIRSALIVPVFLSQVLTKSGLISS